MTSYWAKMASYIRFSSSLAFMLSFKIANSINESILAICLLLSLATEPVYNRHPIIISLNASVKMESVGLVQRLHWICGMEAGKGFPQSV